MSRHVHPQIQPRSLVAISGGRDSVAMLHWLLVEGHSGLIVCHLNHSLRGRESGQDATFVRLLAKKHGLPCEVRKVDVAALAQRQHQSVETAAREVRYEFLKEMAVKHHADRIYLGHHADDQAETILANLCRGAGLNGLAGMKMETELTALPHRILLVRPLLRWRRSEIDCYVADHQLSYREDSSNQTDGPRRNRLRHQVLPLLDEIYTRDVAPIIARCGELAARDDEALWQLAQALIPSHLAPDGSLTLSAELKSTQPVILSRLLRWWLVEHCQVPEIGLVQVEQALSMLQVGGPAKINLAKGLHLRRKARRLWVDGVFVRSC